jgi:predicted acylesterase/phospholipase RssA
MTLQKVRILLPGGGVKGSFQLGFLSQLFKKYPDIEIDAVFGCSIGAILSPFVANKKLDKVIDVFNNIKTIDDVVQRRTLFGVKIPDWSLFNSLFFIFFFGAYERVKLVDEITKILNEEELKIAGEKTHVVSYNYTDNLEEWFSGNKLLEGICCSSALWLAVPPILLSNGKKYCDGGVTELFPVSYIMNHNKKTEFNGKYLFIDLDTREHKKNPSAGNGIEYLLYLQNASLNDLSLCELTKIQDYLGDQLIMIKPDKNIFTSGLEINQSKMKDYFYMGVKAAQNLDLFNENV